MKENVELIQQVIDQAVKAGLFANIQSAATVYQAWEGIKYKLERDGSDSTSADS